MGTTREVYVGDVVEVLVDGCSWVRGVVTQAQSWKDRIEGLRGFEVKMVLEEIDQRMALHGGRDRWVRIMVRLADGRVRQATSPGIRVLKSRA